MWFPRLVVRPLSIRYILTVPFVFALVFLASPSMACHVSAHCVMLISLPNLSDPFLLELRKGALDEARKFGASVTVLDAQNNPRKQALTIGEFGNKQFQVVVVYPIDPSVLVSSLERVVTTNTQLVTIGKKIEGSKVSAHVTFDFQGGGRLAATYIAKRLDGKGVVVYLQGPEVSPERADLAKGFLEAMGTYPNIKATVRETEGIDRFKNAKLVRQILEQEKVNAIFAGHDEIALGAAEAIGTYARDKGIPVIGFGGTATAIQAVKAGKMAGTLSPQPAVMGQLAVRAAVMKSRGETIQNLILVPLQLIGK